MKPIFSIKEKALGFETAYPNCVVEVIRCDYCGKDDKCLTFDTAADEYGQASICKECALKAYSEEL